MQDPDAGQRESKRSDTRTFLGTPSDVGPLEPGQSFEMREAGAVDTGLPAVEDAELHRSAEMDEAGITDIGASQREFQEVHQGQAGVGGLRACERMGWDLRYSGFQMRKILRTRGGCPVGVEWDSTDG